MLSAVARVLLIDDDLALLDVLALAFEDAGHSVVLASDGKAALGLILGDVGLDLVISDINLPGLDGFALCRRVRAEGRTIPLILLTSRDSEVDEALGLDLGADDYVAKPFSTRVLLARVGALLRREAARSGGGPAPIVLGALELDVERLQVRYRGQPVTVTLTEFRLLESLSRRPGIVMSREKLLSLARGDDSVVADRLVDTYVRRLRRKLESVDPEFGAIETVVGAGYRWKVDDRS
jgi:DNA-binding response OmpR family regulator